MTTSLPPRPRRQDREVVMAAAHQIASRLDIWCKRHGVSNDADMIASCCDEDGYRLARNLEQAGWPADEKLTDMLSGTARRALDDAYTKAVREWVDHRTQGVPRCAFRHLPASSGRAPHHGRSAEDHMQLLRRAFWLRADL